MESFERKKLAVHIKNARISERKDDIDTYVLERTGKEYMYEMGGLKSLFKYIRSLDSNIVLDVGAGKGTASYRLKKMPIASGLDLHVTVLRNSAEISKYIPQEKIHVTDIETLRGLKPLSVGGIIASSSIAYSVLPEAAAKRIDEVLISGGVVKATFAPKGKGGRNSGFVVHDQVEFETLFRNLGYDVASEQFSFTALGTSNNEFKSNSILIAIKPGNSKAPSAKKLLNSDLEGIKNASIGRARHGPVFDVKDF